ncbi:hypothetical protein BDW02DRAFT_575654 [Decorospora gaudefroyi]|uniref:Uncharacterized protein n=1 Tax=Decorospora gaudefroyi TaxID=184978 RepID=A0A6A5KVY5_9PLEO|nr:hypothetical protein BDW02DRAFT_575654 [Decorospora gaudefroyi]
MQVEERTRRYFRGAVSHLCLDGSYKHVGGTSVESMVSAAQKRSESVTGDMQKFTVQVPNSAGLTTKELIVTSSWYRSPEFGCASYLPAALQEVLGIARDVNSLHIQLAALAYEAFPVKTNMKKQKQGLQKYQGTFEAITLSCGDLTASRYFAKNELIDFRTTAEWPIREKRNVRAETKRQSHQSRAPINAQLPQKDQEQRGCNSRVKDARKARRSTQSLAAKANRTAKTLLWGVAFVQTAIEVGLLNPQTKSKDDECVTPVA